jgi:hypothetical protein
VFFLPEEEMEKEEEEKREVGGRPGITMNFVN